MTFSEIIQTIKAKFGAEAILEANETVKQPYICLSLKRLVAVCAFLQQTEGLYFDYLANLSGVDLSQENKIGVVYHLYSIVYEHSLVIKCMVEKPILPELPKIPSIAHLWRAADWHEREAYDLLGIFFENHPDLRRILLPEDWEGYPLRKDYQPQDVYHEIKVKY